MSPIVAAAATQRSAAGTSSRLACASWAAKAARQRGQLQAVVIRRARACSNCSSAAVASFCALSRLSVAARPARRCESRPAAPARRPAGLQRGDAPFADRKLEPCRSTCCAIAAAHLELGSRPWRARHFRRASHCAIRRCTAGPTAARPSRAASWTGSRRRSRHGPRAGRAKPARRGRASAMPPRRSCALPAAPRPVSNRPAAAADCPLWHELASRRVRPPAPRRAARQEGNRCRGLPRQVGELRALELQLAFCRQVWATSASARAASCTAVTGWSPMRKRSSASVRARATAVSCSRSRRTCCSARATSR